MKNGVANSDILRSFLGLLMQGKSDFDAIENFRGDAFFKQALGIKLLPSSPTLRQRMDARADELFDFLPTLIETLLAGARADYGVLPCGWLALDVDTFAMDNGDTAKDGVGRTSIRVRMRNLRSDMEFVVLCPIFAGVFRTERKHCPKNVVSFRIPAEAS